MFRPYFLAPHISQLARVWTAVGVGWCAGAGWLTKSQTERLTRTVPPPFSTVRTQPKAHITVSCAQQQPKKNSKDTSSSVVRLAAASKHHFLFLESKNIRDKFGRSTWPKFPVLFRSVRVSPPVWLVRARVGPVQVGPLPAPLPVALPFWATPSLAATALAPPPSPPSPRRRFPPLPLPALPLRPGPGRWMTAAWRFSGSSRG